MHAIAALLLVAFMLLETSVQQGPPPPDAPPPVRVTDRARPDFGYVPWAGSDVTVVVVFSVKCADCVASIPFYGRLRERIGGNNGRRSLVFLAEDGIWPAIEVLKARLERFHPRAVASYPRDDRFALKAMPSVLLFGQSWQRAGEWRGRLDPAAEREVLAAIDQVIAAAKKRGGA